MIKSTSFTQDQRHLTKSSRFQPVKPELIADVLSNHGFTMASLKTGKARLTDRESHQTTIARYRSNTEMKIGGNYLDIVAKVPHLYGAVELFVGTYRVICSNGLTTGFKFDSYKVKHLGNPTDQILEALPKLVAQEKLLVETIQAMQNRVLTNFELIEIANRVAIIRLEGINNAHNVNYLGLLKRHRNEDQGNDLYTVLNVLQENIVRTGLTYQTILTNSLTNETVVRNATARRIGETSVRSININSRIWDVATEFLKVG